MFWKRERPETDDFVKKKYLAAKKKIEISIFPEITSNFVQVLADNLTNNSENMLFNLP